MQQAAALRESESMFRRVIEASADGIVMLDATTPSGSRTPPRRSCSARRPRTSRGLPFGVDDRAGAASSSASSRPGAPSSSARSRPSGSGLPRSSSRSARRPSGGAASSSSRPFRRWRSSRSSSRTSRRSARRRSSSSRRRLGGRSVRDRRSRRRSAAVPPPARRSYADDPRRGRADRHPRVSGDPSRATFTDDDRHFLEGAARVLAESARRERAAAHQRRARGAGPPRAEDGEPRRARRRHRPRLQQPPHGDARAREPRAAPTRRTDSPAASTSKQIETTAQRAAELTNQLLAYAGKGRFVIERVDLSRLVEEMGAPAPHGDLAKTVASLRPRGRASRRSRATRRSSARS